MKDFKPKLSFGVVNSNDFFKKLEMEYQDFRKDSLSTRFAINCALNSWHLTDWVYNEFFIDDDRFRTTCEIKRKMTVTGLRKFQDYSIKKCPELKYMILISNGSKHCILNDSSKKENTGLIQGDFNSRDFNSRDYNVSRLVILDDQENELVYLDLLKRTVVFWRNFFETYNLNKLI